MGKKGVILATFMAFSVGFITGITTVIVKGGKELIEPVTSQIASSPMTREPISIELMEKIEDLKETVRQDPKNFGAWVKLGSIYAEHHRYAEAAEAYGQSLSIKPNDPDVRTNLGLMLKSLGDYDGAIEEFRKAAESQPSHINSRYYLGLTLIQNKRNIQEGIQAWKDYLKVESKGQRANQVRSQMERLKAGTLGDKGDKTD